MADLIDAGSNPASESTPVHEAPQAEAPKPSSSPREALERAFAGVDKPAPVDTTKPAGERPRDEAGRFAPKAGDEPVKAAEPKPATPEVKPEPAPTVGAPPARFAKAAQAEWDKVPEVVRQETERAINELTAGVEKYKASAEAFEAIRQFDEMAKAGGTDLKTALSAYTGMEQLLRQDPVRGILAVCQNLGVNPRDIGQALTGVQSQGGASPEVIALKQEIAALKDQLGGVDRTIKQRDVVAQIESFAKDHPHFEAVSETMAQMISTGFAKDLPDAYDKAIRLSPEVQALIASEEAAKAAQTAPRAQTPPKAGLSVTGSPTGSNPGSKTPAGSPREAVVRAAQALGIA